MELDLLQIARDLIRANTVSARGTAAAVAVLRPLWEQLGFSTTVLEGPASTPSAPQLSLLARAGPEKGEGFLGVTHLDTVDPGPREAWRSDPFALQVENGRWVGLGVADVKIDAACKLLGFARLDPAKLHRPLAFLGTHLEELGCQGARHFAQSPAFPARYVACGEPSELRLIDAHKGYAVVRTRILDRQPEAVKGPLREMRVTGRAAHSSTPQLGESAILKAWPQLSGAASVQAGTVANKVAAELRAQIPDPSGQAGEGFRLQGALALARGLWEAWSAAAAASAPAPNPRFDPPGCVVNWGALRSEGPNLELLFDARLLPGQTPASLLDAFQKQAQAHSGPRYAVEVQVERSNEAMALARPSALLDAAQGAAKGLGLNPEPQAKPTNTEAGVFAAAGMEAIVFGPGISKGNAHCANEFQLEAQCRQAVDFYQALARRLCGGG